MTGPCFLPIPLACSRVSKGTACSGVNEQDEIPWTTWMHFTMLLVEEKVEEGDDLAGRAVTPLFLKYHLQFWRMKIDEGPHLYFQVFPSCWWKQMCSTVKCNIPLQSRPGPWHKLLINKCAQGIQLYVLVTISYFCCIDVLGWRENVQKAPCGMKFITLQKWFFIFFFGF